MRNFFLAFLVFLAWSVLAIWYLTTDAKTTIASIFKIEEKESPINIDSLSIKIEQDAIFKEDIENIDSIFKNLNPDENPARLYALNELNDVIFAFDTIFIKKNIDSVFYKNRQKNYIEEVADYLNENKEKELIILSDYSAREDFTNPNFGLKRGRFIINELVKSGVDKNHISVKSLIKDLPFSHNDEYLGGVIFRFQTISEERLEEIERNRTIKRIIYPTFTFSTIYANKELKDFAAELKSIMEDYPQKTVQIVGHTDNIGSSMDTYQMGLKYAQQVRWYLINNQNLDKDRLKASSLGKDNPIDVNTTVAGRNKNRRIEFIIE